MKIKYSRNLVILGFIVSTIFFSVWLVSACIQGTLIESLIGIRLTFFTVILVLTALDMRIYREVKRLRGEN
jgi:hypothetical protein